MHKEWRKRAQEMVGASKTQLGRIAKFEKTHKLHKAPACPRNGNPIDCRHTFNQADESAPKSHAEELQTLARSVPQRLGGLFDDSTQGYDVVLDDGK